MKNLVLFCLLVFFVNTAFSQISSGSREFFYKQLVCIDIPALDKISTTNLSFAYSFRKLRAGYTGSCMRIRRASDNVEADVPFSCLNFADTLFIKTFLNGSLGYVVKWYDQSTLARDAVNTIPTQQPLLNLAAFNNKIGIVFDGVDDYLKVNTSMLTLTNNGLEGSIFMVIKATTAIQFQFNFGVEYGLDRWSFHANWVDNYLYFDPGYCCTPVRSFDNTSGISDFFQYSMIRGTTTSSVFKESVLGFTSSASTSPTTLNVGPTLGAVARPTGDIFAFSNSIFQEFIMFKLDITGTDKTTLETDQMAFW